MSKQPNLLASLVGENIARKRKLLGMTQEQLAELAGIGQQSLSRMEKGRIAPRFERLQALANALGCSVPDIFRSPGIGAEERVTAVMELFAPLSVESQEALLKAMTSVAYAMMTAETRR